MQSFSEKKARQQLDRSLELIEQIKNDKNHAKSKLKIFKKLTLAKNDYEEAKKEAENKYNEKLNKLFRVICASDDYETAFEMRLLGGFGYKQDIAQGQELIKKASRLGLTSAITWLCNFTK
ncbi:9562_t:CDS:2 [Racocetra persica]|uniref:9562_t:CDS:1 n=1 Tax=Racocetra persica TaxID=160502 RepID=A0ACA9L6A4_9GLOM|nr:9562_t:CDS:2 [Racocetra persica]